MTKIFFLLNKFCNRDLKAAPPGKKKQTLQHPEYQIFYCSLMWLNFKDEKVCHSVLTLYKQDQANKYKLITAWKAHMA